MAGLTAFTKRETIEDFKPSPVGFRVTTSHGVQGRVRAQISARCRLLQLDIGGVKYDMVKTKTEYGPAIQNHKT